VAKPSLGVPQIRGGTMRRHLSPIAIAAASFGVKIGRGAVAGFKWWQAHHSVPAKNRVR